MQGILYNGPFTPVCAICTQSLKRMEIYARDLSLRAYTVAAATAQRDRKRGYQGPPLTPEVVEEVMRVGQCSYCGASDHLSVDHIVPLSRGGTHEPTNLTCACRVCNSAKRAMTDAEFRAWIRRVAAHLNL